MSIAGILVVFGIVTMDNGGDNGNTPEEHEEENQADDEIGNLEEKNEDQDVANENE